MSDWYVLQTKSRQEALAERNLSNQKFHTFLPLLEVQKQHHGRWRTTLEPLFPGYLFVELDMKRQNTAPIRSTRGVIRILCLGGKFQPVPKSLLHALMRAQIAPGEAIDPLHFESGDEVRLTNGPMAGLKAIFKAQNSQDRVVLLLDILGAETQISISSGSIVKLEKSTCARGNICDPMPLRSRVERSG